MICVGKKTAAVLRSTKIEARERRLREFERHINEGVKIGKAAELSGISYMEARNERAREAVKRWSAPGVGRSVAERGAFLMEVYLERLEEVEAAMAECRDRIQAFPKSSDVASEWIKLTKELREMFAERAALEERLAALGSHVPTLSEVAEVDEAVEAPPLPTLPEKADVATEVDGA